MSLPVPYRKKDERSDTRVSYRVYKKRRFKGKTKRIIKKTKKKRKIRKDEYK